MKLYTISGAPRGWRVQTALLFKALDYELKLLEGSKQEHKKRPFLNIHPRGVVPVVEHEGQYITDSIGIMAWLDRAFPDNPLFGKTAQAAGKIWSLSTDLEDNMRHTHHAFIFPILVQNQSIDEMSSDTRQLFRERADKLWREFEQLEDRLSRNKFLCSAEPSAADAVAFPDARLIERTNEKNPEAMQEFGFDQFDQRFPNLRAWMDRISELPGFEKCLPPHWSKVAA